MVTTITAMTTTTPDIKTEISAFLVNETEAQNLYKSNKQMNSGKDDLSISSSNITVQAIVWAIRLSWENKDFVCV